MNRNHKPSAIGVSPSLPQPTVSICGDQVQGTLPTGGSVTVHLFGATVTSWKLGNGEEQLFLSEKAHLDGSKPIRGGIPLVFPVFGPPPKDHATHSLPQHGFARSSHWEFLGKSSSESLERTPKGTGEAVKLDFGLTSSMLSQEFREAWPYEFGLLYTVTLTEKALETQLQVHNEGDATFEFQVLMHSYLKVNDISDTRLLNLQSKAYIDKTQNATKQMETSPAVPITGETDRVYQDVNPESPVVVASFVHDNIEPVFNVTREDMREVVVWNPWAEKTKSMSDLAPDDAYRRFVCVESGAVGGWQALEAGEFWVGGQTIEPVKRRD